VRAPHLSIGGTRDDRGAVGLWQTACLEDVIPVSALVSQNLLACLMGHTCQHPTMIARTGQGQSSILAAGGGGDVFWAACLQGSPSLR